MSNFVIAHDDLFWLIVLGKNNSGHCEERKRRGSNPEATIFGSWVAPELRLQPCRGASREWEEQRRCKDQFTSFASFFKSSGMVMPNCAAEEVLMAKSIL